MSPPRLPLVAAALALAAALSAATAHAQRSLVSLGARLGTGVCGTPTDLAWQDGFRAGVVDCLDYGPSIEGLSASLAYDVAASGPSATVGFLSSLQLSNAKENASLTAQVGYGDVIWWDDPRIATMEVLPTLHGLFATAWDPGNYVDPAAVEVQNFGIVGFAGSPYPTQPGVVNNDFSCTTNSFGAPVWAHVIGPSETIDWSLDPDTPISCRSNVTHGVTGRPGLAFKYYGSAQTNVVYDTRFDTAGDALGYWLSVTGDFMNTTFLALRFRDASGRLVDDPQYSTLSGLTYAAAPPGAGPAVAPEPASLALTASGLALLVAAGYRRRVARE